MKPRNVLPWMLFGAMVLSACKPTPMSVRADVEFSEIETDPSLSPLLIGDAKIYLPSWLIERQLDLTGIDLNGFDGPFYNSCEPFTFYTQDLRPEDQQNDYAIGVVNVQWEFPWHDHKYNHGDGVSVPIYPGATDFDPEFFGKEDCKGISFTRSFPYGEYLGEIERDPTSTPMGGIQVEP